MVDSHCKHHNIDFIPFENFRGDIEKYMELDSILSYNKPPSDGNESPTNSDNNGNGENGKTSNGNSTDQNSDSDTYTPIPFTQNPFFENHFPNDAMPLVCAWVC